MGAVCQHARAWTEFWQEQDDASACCAGSPEIQQPIHDHWRTFSAGLVAGSHVLDLGCGAGTAARTVIRAKPSLHATGVDFASVPPSGDPRIRIVANSRMEALPFADRSFDVAVSQFGFEYASVGEASSELARVLRPGAPFSFLVHHSDARIVGDTGSCREALAAICGDGVRDAFLLGQAQALDQELRQIRRRFPYERTVEQAQHGLLRHVAQADAQRAAIWRAVEAALAPELIMLDDLVRSSVSPGRLKAWLRPLSKHFKLCPPAVLTMSTGQPLCWKIGGARRT